MINANNPEINIDELMEKIRAEVAKRHSQSQSVETTQSETKTTYKELPYIAPTFNYNFIHLETLLRNAESRAIARTKWPDHLSKFPYNFIKPIQVIAFKILNFIFKDQREVNFNVIRALKESVALNRQLIEQIKDLKTQIEYLNAVDARLEGIEERFSTVDTCLQVMEEGLGVVSNRVPGINEDLNNFNSWIGGIQKRLDAVNNQDHLINEHLSTVDSHIQGLNEHLSTVDSHIQGLNEHLGTVDARIQGLNEHLGTVNSHVQNLHEQHLRNDSFLKNDLVQQKRLITMFLEEAQRRLKEPLSKEHLETFVKEEQHLLDAFYVAFENQFRGTREDIHNRLKVYLPLLEEAKVGTPDSLILDVGCGRGEWLELLRESGYTAKGIDINRVMLQQCRAIGLDVIESDVIEYLQSLPDASLGAVTGFHIIEHLPFETLMKLFTETVRVLKPEGLVIFETPNPDNILVGSNAFYTDPTHRNPLPSPTIKFIAESFGLCKVKIMNLHPLENQKLAVDGSLLAERFNQYFYGPQDYSLIGYKHG
ncbi:class I SAM-dependent methyltransferase [Brasilonema sp. UFV-L1]|uniref:class I SAM-dependent methyltransferase n=1 Tax=Brasilonema sp. UFV-L1 TaxID=2234130 RepID=UPI00145C4906|nr:class I SAM-dependent methyltransferase [Brasilonema sp. UFV-L1]NMG08326.1 SAM-dependent methyltransferase [Brasilonema sp. UFV-L1]